MQESAGYLSIKNNIRRSLAHWPRAASLHLGGQVGPAFFGLSCFCRFSLGLLPVPDEGAKHIYFLRLVRREVETVLSPEAQLQKVVIQCLFGHPDFDCGLVNGVADSFAVASDPLLELTPFVNQVNDLLDSAAI